MTHVLRNVMAMAILAISGKRDVIDVFILWLRPSDLKRALSQATFSCGHDHWRCGSQDRSASFRHPVLRKDQLVAENPAHRRTTSLRNQRLELLGGDRCGEARRVSNRGDQAPLSRIWQRHPGIPPLAITRAMQDNRNRRTDRASEENETPPRKGGSL